MDAPCTGDGAIRKLPDRCVKFSPLDGNNSHFIQVAILIRALRLLKEGGVCVYSTCSLNAVENEAVVTEALRVMNEKEKLIELEDVHGRIKDFKMRRGLKKWSLFAKKKNEVTENEEALEEFVSWE